MGKRDGRLWYRPQRTNYSLSDRNCPMASEHAKWSSLQTNSIKFVQNAINKEINSEIYSTNIICYADVSESLTNLFCLLINKKFSLGFLQTLKKSYIGQPQYCMKSRQFNLSSSNVTFNSGCRLAQAAMCPTVF